MTSNVLDRRALGRATLARQLLLERRPLPVLDAVEHLVGLQAQEPLDPYTALWSRLEGFDPDVLAGLLVDRSVARIVVMRTTIHLVTAADAVALRPLFQPILDRELRRHRDYRGPLERVDLAPVLAYARRLLAEEPRTPAQLRKAFAEEFPDRHAAALTYACRNHLALVQLPPRGVWGRTGQVRYDSVENWLGRPVTGSPSIDDAVRRYLAAFGPATAADVAAWSGLTGLREVMDRLRGELRVVRDERGRELFDLPDAPLPDPDTPAPVRFLPEYDNVLLAHADRTRIVAEEHRRVFTDAMWKGGVLHDGMLAGAWRRNVDKASGKVTLTVHHPDELTPAVEDELAAEGLRLLRFLAPETTDHDVRFAPIGR